MFHVLFSLRLCLIITLCIQTQEECEEFQKMSSVSEAAEENGEIETKKKKFSVSVFNIFEK